MYSDNRLLHNWLIKRAVNIKVEEQLPKFKNGQVLDLGCGNRPFEPDILKYAEKYIGVDWGNTIHGLNADIVADLNSGLPIPDNSFDHVVSFEVIEHLKEPGVMLSEAYRVLKNGGSLTLSCPFMWWVHEAPWDYFRFTKFGLNHLLEKAGFGSIEIKETTGFWTMWFLKLNYQLTRLIRGPKIMRKLIRAALVPFWWSNQYLALALDRVWKESRETSGYFVVARKP